MRCDFTDDEDDYDEEIEANMGVLNVAHRAVVNILELLVEDIDHWDDEDDFALEGKFYQAKVISVISA